MITTRRNRGHLRLVKPGEMTQAEARAGIRELEARHGDLRTRAAADPIAVSAIVASDPVLLLVRLNALTGGANGGESACTAPSTPDGDGE
jgi:hypothetical protein